MCTCLLQVCVVLCACTCPFTSVDVAVTPCPWPCTTAWCEAMYRDTSTCMSPCVRLKEWLQGPQPFAHTNRWIFWEGDRERIKPYFQKQR